MDVLIVVDMQEDFISGALGTPEAQAIVPAVTEKIREFQGPVFATQDIHGEDYLLTQEGKNLPVPHCLKGSKGAQLCPEVQALLTTTPFEKSCFGSWELAEYMKQVHARSKIREIQLVGLCTDVCVISNAMLLKAALPEVKITVDSACCAGVTPESHAVALQAMAACQITVL